MGNQKQLSSRIRRKRFANFESVFYSTQLQRWEIQILRNFTLSFLKKVFLRIRVTSITTKTSAVLFDGNTLKVP